ncbi:MAG: hypothetical protein JNL58_19805 [Planctomyces sp.]|nr:hypothetical protein [Planctomyces sp.]
MTRLNFTGRRKISQAHVRITVTGIGGIETFNAEIDLSTYQFPDSARIVIEAFRQLELVRFDFGTIGQQITPEHRRLSLFGTSSGLRFRLKVISSEPPRGQLLGVADRIAPLDEHRTSMLRVPLLAVRSQDLGREIWRLDLSDEPLLLVNSRVIPRKHLITSPEFQCLVLPEILRNILIRILIIDQVRDFDDSDEWTARWLRFACSLPGLPPLGDHSGPDQDMEWIDQAIGAFCRWRTVDDQFRNFWKLRPIAESDVDTIPMQNSSEQQA